MTRSISKLGLMAGLAFLLVPVAVGQNTVDKRPNRRLPNNYGKLDLSDAQKEKIYSLQDKYGDQIDALQTQIDKLKEKRDTEIRNVLTTKQKQDLSKVESSKDKK